MYEQIAEDIKREVSVVGEGEGMYNGVELHRHSNDRDEANQYCRSREEFASAEDQKRLHYGRNRKRSKDGE